jgi:hypothetical protein
MMSHFPDSLYKTLVRELPIACIDIVISCDDKFLLVKRLQDPLSGEYWLPGGRIFIGEQISEAASRIVLKELGIQVASEIKMRFLGITNMIFSDSSWGKHLYHTPSIIIQMIFHCKPSITLDYTSTDYIWSDSLPPLFTQHLVHTDSYV